MWSKLSIHQIWLNRLKPYLILVDCLWNTLLFIFLSVNLIFKKTNYTFIQCLALILHNTLYEYNEVEPRFLFCKCANYYLEDFNCYFYIPERLTRYMMVCTLCEHCLKYKYYRIIPPVIFKCSGYAVIEYSLSKSFPWNDKCTLKICGSFCMWIYVDYLFNVSIRIVYSWRDPVLYFVPTWSLSLKPHLLLDFKLYEAH